MRRHHLLVRARCPKLIASKINPRTFLYKNYGLPFYAHSLTTTNEYFAKEKALCAEMTAACAKGEVRAAQPQRDDRDHVQGGARAEARLHGAGADRDRHGRVVVQLRFQEAMEQGVAWADPAIYQKMTDTVFSAGAAAGDKKPDPASLYTNGSLAAEPGRRRK